MSKKKVEKELEVRNKKANIMIVDDLVKLKETDSKINEELYNKWEKESKERLFTNIKKLKCDYTTYKEERTKYNMPVEEVCSKCGKSFKTGEEIYTAFEEGKQGSQIICGNCANGE